MNEKTLATKPEGVRVRQSATTRSTLIRSARELFTKQGYHGTSTPEIAAHAGVTRGALYHHFPDKKSLFFTVFQSIELELVSKANLGTETDFSPREAWTIFKSNIISFLNDVASRPDVQQIILIDGPAVLGWRKWRELQADPGLGFITSTIEVSMARGYMKTFPATPLAHMLLASVSESALMIANSDEPKKTYEEVVETLNTVLSDLTEANDTN